MLRYVVALVLFLLVAVSMYATPPIPPAGQEYVKLTVKEVQVRAAMIGRRKVIVSVTVDLMDGPDRYGRVEFRAGTRFEYRPLRGEGGRTYVVDTAFISKSKGQTHWMRIDTKTKAVLEWVHPNEARKRRYND